MAKIKHKIGKNKKPKGNKLYNKIGKDVGAAAKTAEEFLDIGPLSQVDTAYSSDRQGALDKYKGMADSAGQRSPEMAAFLNRMQGLTSGYDSQEYEALRSQRRNEMEKGYQSGQAGLMRGQSVNRLGAGQKTAQLLQLAKNYGETSSAAENDLFVEGAREKRDAISNYGGALRGAETDENARGSKAMADYTGYLSDSETDQFGKQKFNAGQEAASRALKSGGILGMLGVGESRRAGKRSSRLIREGYRSNEKIAEIGAQQASAMAEAIAKLQAQYGG